MESINQDSAQEINKIIDLISHDFKVPLTSISFNIHSIKRMLRYQLKNDHAILFKKIECIEARTEHMSRVLEQMMDLARAQLADLPLKKNLTYTHDLLAETFRLAHEKSSENLVELENHQMNQYCTVACDKDRLVQVFSNIIYSLAELNPAKSAIKLSTKVKDEVAQFFFKTESQTLDESLLNTILDRFCVFNCTRTSLGLALSKWVIEAHKGSISIESKDKIGTIFKIELPKIELDQLKASLA